MLPSFFVTMHAISWKGHIDLSVCCLKKIDNRHSLLKSHLLPIKWKSHYWLSQGVSAHVEEEITYWFSPYNLAACKGQSHPYFSTRSVLFTSNHASPQAVVSIKHS